MKTLIFLLLFLIFGCTVVLKSPCYVMKSAVELSPEVTKYTYYDIQGNCPVVVVYSSEKVMINDTLRLNK